MPAASSLSEHLNKKTVPPEWQGTGMPFPRDRSVLDLFQDQVKTQPDAIALREGLRQVTYHELDARSQCLAAELRRHHLQNEEAVVILLPASCEFVIAALAILKASGSYLPLDPETPSKRLEFLLVNSHSRFAVSNAAQLRPLSEWSGTVLDPTQIINAAGEPDKTDLPVLSDPHRRAYIIYTSGSTGQPKGVEIEHHSLTNLVSCYRERFNLSADDRASMLANVAFDASVADVWPILCAGGSLVIPAQKLYQDPDGLIQWFAAQAVTLAFVPTGMVEILLRRAWPNSLRLRFLITGGDRLRLRPAENLPFTLINAYGPTENTVVSTLSNVTSENGVDQPPPIGQPLGNVKAYVLDAELLPSPIGQLGELYLGGEQVARGYLGRPELTRERFVEDPFAEDPAARLYRTGDWVRWLETGELDFLGRQDDQIQIRGCRVELGEIEAAIFNHASVQQVCCVPRLIDGQPVGVVAHIVSNTPEPSLAEKLKASLVTHLPEYMVPSAFVFHDQLPLTPQGKADRKAMMAKLSTQNELPAVVAGRNELEKALSSLWHTLLPAAADAPPEATFAQLGGDSLQAIKLSLGVEEITRQRLEISTFLLKPTFTGLCEAVEINRSGTAFQPVVAIRKVGSRPPLFCLYGITGDVDEYFNLAKALGDDQPVYAIRSPAFHDLKQLPDSIEAVAAQIVRAIRQIQPSGPPMLVGYSLAGLFAFEVARQIERLDGESCFVAMIGTDAPVGRFSLIERFAHFLRHAPNWIWLRLKQIAKGSGSPIQWRNMARRAKHNLVEARPPWGAVPETIDTPFSRHMAGLVAKYHPPFRYQQFIHLIRERDEYWNHIPVHPLHYWQANHLPDVGWQRWTEKPNCVYWIDGNHLSVLTPPLVSGLAQTIRKAMDLHLQR